MDFVSIAGSIIASVLVGIGSSILASLVFIHLYLARKVPKIEISDLIAREPNGDGVAYWFKYVNRTNVPIYDVKVDTYLLTPTGGDGGQNLIIDKIEMRSTIYTHVPCETKDDKNALHAVQVRCLDNLSAKWHNPASFVRFQIVAKHELSGFSKVFVKDYHRINKICDGSFKFGNNLTVS